MIKTIHGSKSPWSPPSPYSKVTSGWCRSMHHMMRLVISFKANKKDKRTRIIKNFILIFFIIILIICCNWWIIKSVSFVGSYSNYFTSILTYGLLVLLRKIADDIIEVIVQFLWDNGIIIAHLKKKKKWHETSPMWALWIHPCKKQTTDDQNIS